MERKNLYLLDLHESSKLSIFGKRAKLGARNKEFSENKEKIHFSGGMNLLAGTTVTLQENFYNGCTTKGI